MPEKEPAFTVTDRRKFTSEGELRGTETQPDESTEAPSNRSKSAPASQPAVEAAPEPLEMEQEDLGAEPTAEESAQQAQNYHASSRQLDEALEQAHPAGSAAGPMSFDRLVQSIYMTAAMQMGAGTAPGEQARVDILGARQSIDMLAVLEEKTKGNLTEDEKRLLQGALFELRMSFVEITKAIANSAQRQPKPGGAGRG